MQETPEDGEVILLVISKPPSYVPLKPWRGRPVEAAGRSWDHWRVAPAAVPVEWSGEVPSVRVGR